MANQEQDKKVAPASVSATSNQRWYIILIVAVLVSAGAGLVAGLQIGRKGDTPGGMTQGRQGMGQRGGGQFGMMRGGFGTVTEVTDSSVTISAQLPMSQDQGSQETTTYTVTSSTKVANSGETAAVSDIKVGDRVMIQTDNSDSKTATSIEINPQMRGGPGMSSGGTTSSGQGA